MSAANAAAVAPTSSVLAVGHAALLLGKGGTRAQGSGAWGGTGGACGLLFGRNGAGGTP